MAGYTRTDTTNNIADGNIINATDLDNEFDGIQAAFNSSTGHNHDGTTGEGAPILLLGPTQDVVVGAAAVTPKTTNTVDIGSGSLKFKDLFLAGNASIGGTLAVTGVATLTAQPVLSSLTASSAVATDASKGLVSVTNTGTGNNVLATSPTLVTPALGTPSSATLTNATGLPVATGISGLGSGVATFLATPSSANLAAAVTDETGTGALVFANSPTLVTPALGTPASGVVTNLTGTASININGTVGATTATTGAFTTLSASGDVTLSGGTANGVAFANGSKVLTTGSALTFDGTNLGVGIGGAGTAPIDVASNGSAIGLMLRGRSADSIGTLQFQSNDGATVRAQIQSRGDELRFLSAGNVPQTYYVNGSEQMRLTSTGLGIGTSSPTSKLDVSGGSSTGGLTVSGSIASVRASSTVIDTGDGNRIMALGANTTTPGTLKFIVASSNASVYTTAATLDSSGNLGIGTSSPGSKLAVTGAAGTGSIAVLTNSTATSTTTFANPILKLISGASGADSSIQFTDNITANGYVSWKNSTLNFSTNSGINHMMLDSSGNLGLGVTPSAWGSGTQAIQVGSASVFYNPGSTNQTWLYNNAYNNGTNELYLNTAAASSFRMVGGAYQWFTAPSGTAGNAISFTQAMTLTAAGELCLGTTSSGTSAAALTFADTNALKIGFNGGAGNFYGISKLAGGGNLGDGEFKFTAGNTSGGAFTFSSNGSERARIDSSGNLLVGTTSASYSDSTSNIISLGAIYVQHVNGTGSGNNYMGFAYAGSAIGSITQSGTTAVLYNTTSDQRLKENIQDAAPASALIDALQVRQYDWKADGSHQRYGFIAQELVTVAPEAVHQPADLDDMMAVDYSKLVPMLVKEIQDLRARLAAANI